MFKDTDNEIPQNQVKYKLSPFYLGNSTCSFKVKILFFYLQQQQIDLESMKYAASSSSFSEEQEPKRKKYKKDAYFSDEEEFEDGWPETLTSTSDYKKMSHCYNCLKP